ncbi:MAG: hypothetical protein H6733_03640 [Alphaproteobacteria bacterium]|nr:hypothetical protein [Alphaproteobacteria bacterium]
MDDVTALTVELALVAAAMGAAVVAVLAATPQVLRAMRRQGPAWMAALAAAVVVSEGVGLTVVPRSILDMNHHGLQVWSAVTRDAWSDLGNAEHGPAHLLTWRVLQPLLPAGARPWGAGHVAASLSVLLVGLLTWRLTGRRHAGVIAAFVLGLAPFHLRLAPSLSGYGAWEMWSLLAACGVVAWRWTGTVRDAVIAGAAGYLAASTRADGLLFLPALLLGVGLAAPARGPVAWRSAWGAAPFAVLWSARFVRALFHHDEPLEATGLFVAHLPALVVVSAVWAAAAIAGRLASPRGLTVGARGALAVGVALTGAAAGPFTGTWPAFPGVVDSVLRVHPLLHPLLAPPLVVVAAGVGLAWLGRRRPVAAAVVVVLQAFATFLHFVVVGEDSVSFYVRDASGLGWGLAALAGAGLGGVVPARWAAAAVGAVALAVVVDARGMLTHAWPTQQEVTLLFGPVDALAPEATVHTLAPTDLVAPVDAAMLRPLRVDLAGLMSHDNRLADRPRWSTVAAALADPPAAVGHYWWQGLACVQAEAGRSGPDGDRVYAGGRLWRFDARQRVSSPPAHPELEPWLDLAALPCAADGDGTCIAPGDDGCALWACDRRGPPSTPYLDPLCAAMAEAFVLEPVAVVTAGGGSLDSDRLVQLDPSARVGLFRIAGVRAGDEAP